MPTAPDRRRIGRSLSAVALLAASAVLTLAGCGRPEPPMNPTNPTASATGSPSPGGSGTASPDPTASPGDSATPGETATPGSTPSGSVSPSGSVAPVSCTSVTPIRVERSAVEPRRTTEVVTVVSDGRNLTPGTREQTAFQAPTLTAPDGVTQIEDEATLTKIGELIESGSKNTVLLARPDPPDTGVDTNERPYNATGTYVLYNASGLLGADVVVDCSGQEQRWRFTAEADNTVGTINCAVEPPKGNAVARQVYGTFC
jgi:hypothetical protein